MQKDELFVTAALARLELGDDEAEKLNEAISNMLEYFSLMDKIDVDNLAPTTHVGVKNNRTRGDQNFNSGFNSRHNTADKLICDVMVENAPEKDGRFITIPNVL